MRNFIKKHLGWICVITLFFVYAITDFFWLRTNSIDPHWDMARHLWTSLFYFNNYLRFPYIPGLIKAWTNTYQYYPPFVYLATSIVYKITGHHTEVVAIASELLFVATLLSFTYLVAQKFFSQKTSIIATIFILTIPFVFTQFHDYMLDLPLLAIFVMTLYMLIRSDHLRNPLFTILLGLCIGLGLMTKWTYVFVIIPPVLWEFMQWGRIALKSVKKSEWESIKREVITIMLCLFVVLLIALPWYMNNALQLNSDLRFNALYGKSYILKPGITWALDYVFLLENTHLFLPYFLIFVAGFVYTTFINKELKKQFWWILFSFTLSYIFFTAVNTKDSRYLAPLLIYVTLYSVSFFEAIKNRVKNTIAITAFILFACIQSYYVSFYSSVLHTLAFSVGNLGEVTIMNDYVYATAYTSGSPVADNFPVKQIVSDAVAAYNKVEQNGTYIVYHTQTKDIWTYNSPMYENMLDFVGDNDVRVNTWELVYYIRLDGSNLGKIENSTVFDKGGLVLIHYNNDAKSQLFIKTLPASASLIKAYHLPDKTIAYLYQLGSDESLYPQQCEQLLYISEPVIQCRET